MTEPTKGPLHIIEWQRSGIQVASKQHYVAEFFWYGTRSSSRDEALANARLFAAARAMMEALEALVTADFDSHPQDFAPEWHAARAALALAKGEQ